MRSLLNTKVLVLFVENSVSNANPEWLANIAFRPLGACGYAATPGTIPADEGRFLNTTQGGFAGRGESSAERLVHHVRQGIAASRRHIAPALLLC